MIPFKKSPKRTKTQEETVSQPRKSLIKNRVLKDAPAETLREAKEFDVEKAPNTNRFLVHPCLNGVRNEIKVSKIQNNVKKLVDKFDHSIINDLEKNVKVDNYTHQNNTSTFGTVERIKENEFKELNGAESDDLIKRENFQDLKNKIERKLRVKKKSMGITKYFWIFGFILVLFFIRLNISGLKESNLYNLDNNYGVFVDKLEIFQHSLF